jgi:uncharacterized protein (TIGR00299 family) protein
MKTLYLDCQAGIAGDMTVAALLDLGVPLEYLQTELTRLPLPHTAFRLETEPCRRHGIAATRFVVHEAEHQPHRHYTDIAALIEASSLTEPVKERAQRIFFRLAEAEAKVHGMDIGQVHFHEVGAIDSLVDIVGAAICLEYLSVGKIFASPLPLGSGFVETAHGLLPVPAPATAELLRGLPVHDRIGPGERVTPTGAAIIAALINGIGIPAGFTTEKIGYGAGTKDFDDTPNILRAFLGTSGRPLSREEIVVIETNIDDSSPEALGYAMERFLTEGALDVWFTPIQMKKNRPAVMLSILASAADSDRLSQTVFTETTAIGLRSYPVSRNVLERRIEERQTRFGPVRFKVTDYGAKPEFDDCRRIATEQGLPLREVCRLLDREGGAP